MTQPGSPSLSAAGRIGRSGSVGVPGRRGSAEIQCRRCGLSLQLEVPSYESIGKFDTAGFGGGLPGRCAGVRVRLVVTQIAAVEKLPSR